MDENQNQAPYSQLTPELILNAVEVQGLSTSGRMLALNSYENRVYQIELADESYVVAKFYRPGRWSNESILEEHTFTRELVEQDIPVVAPLVFDGQTLLEYQGYRFALFPRRGGRWPELDDPENRNWLGRFIGRIHAVGRASTFAHRRRLTIESWGEESLQFLLHENFVPKEIQHNFEQAARTLLDRMHDVFDSVSPIHYIRIHGDCHPGNILWTPQGPHFVDLDDCCMGPAVQDLWMLLSGERDEMAKQLVDILEGYQMFCDFDYSQLVLIESLRGLRLIHYCAWLARRWNDPAFPQHFPWFNTPRYWEDQLNTLREQIERLEQPPISLH